LIDALLTFPVDTGEDLGHILGIGAVEVEVHLVWRLDRRGRCAWGAILRAWPPGAGGVTPG